MFENMSETLLRIISNAEEEIERMKRPFITSEILLLAMFKEKNTICRFLLLEYGVKLEEIYEEINRFIVIIKKTQNKRFSKSLQDIFTLAGSFVFKKGQKIEDEHVFLALLYYENSIAYNLIDSLGLDAKELIEEVNGIFNFEDYEVYEEKPLNKQKIDNNYTRNITELIKEKKASPFIGRKEYLERLKLILNRKTKNNPLLIGSAGVGKSALVEGLARDYYENSEKFEIISLELGLVLSGAKYRGDFEERIFNIIKQVEKNKDCILFIDEIHNLIGAGSSEGGMDAANLLKPILSRNNIKCIGATTLEEYKKFIENDKALNRRFQTVFIEEPDDHETLTILKGIKPDFESYHNIEIKDEILKYLVEETKARIINRKFPDKAIDVLDEVMTYKKTNILEEIDYKDVDYVIDSIMGLRKDRAKNNTEIKELKKYALRYSFALDKNRATILNIFFKGNKNGLESLLENIMRLFCIKNEMILKLDFSLFQEAFSLTSLIGSPPGYIGYDQGGLLTEHLGKFPLSVILIKDFSSAHPEITSFFLNALEKGEVLDRKGKNCYFRNTIFVFTDNKININKIGFFKQEKTKKQNNLIDFIDEVLDINITNQETDLNEFYLNRFLNKGYNLEIDFPINKDNRNLVDECLFTLNSSEKGFYKLVCSDEREISLIKLQK